MARSPALLLILVLAAPLLASDLDRRSPTKPTAAHDPPPADPEVLRQGGDTIADAVVVTLPYQGSGTTVGYTDDYDEACPFTQSTSPDVVYSFDYAGDYANVGVDLCGSSYDTKVYVYDADLQLMGCNDDFYFDDVCGMYVSRIEGMPLAPGVYHVVIDGYGGDAGEYEVAIQPWGTPWLVCPPGSQLEEEPPCGDDYVDAHNGGCDVLGDLGHAPMQALTGTTFCGRAGWYACGGGVCTDADWLTLVLPAAGAAEIGIEANGVTTISQLGPTDCEQAAVLQTLTVDILEYGSLTIVGEPGAEVWLRVASADAGAPGDDYLYLLDLPDVVAARPMSWSGIKALYD